ncbi:MAG: twin-arginine translocation pathway signal [Alphaproteobacteria bacterium]|nr:MAG: twin-arginine translocation pathway signal [Alphaproteobacteria bacterium]
MQDRTAGRASLASLVARIAGAFWLGALVSGCSSTGDNLFTVFADPGKYQYSSCEHLAGQRKYWSGREQELRLLMDKAEQSAGGGVVNVLAYKADYVAATEELKVLEIAARAKNCESPENWRSNSVVR